MKKLIKGFETKLNFISFSATDIESQLNLIMRQGSRNKGKGFTQCRSLGSLLSYSFKEDTLDLQFAFKMVVLYTRSKFQKMRKELIESLLTKSRAKRQMAIKQLITNERDYKNKYTQYGIEKAYSLLMVNNAYIRKKIRKYNEQRNNLFTENII